MAGAHGRGASRFFQDQIEQKILAHCLEAGTGVIPDPDGHWLSLKSLSSVFGKSHKTITNWISAAKRNRGVEPDRWPGLDYYRFYTVLWVIHAEEKA